MTGVRFLLDEHLGRALASGLQRRGIEAATVHDVGRRSASDESHLLWARENGWVLATGDQDFVRLAAVHLDHAGIAFYPNRRSIGTLVRRLSELAAAETMESMRGRVEYI
jgi:uncharacterized protein with PIN domain